MAGLEDILKKNFLEIRDFYANWLNLSPAQVRKLKDNWAETSIDKGLDCHAALVFSQNDRYLFTFRPEAVGDALAEAEEVAHYFSLMLNPKAKSAILRAKKGSEDYIALEAQQEYVARRMALEYLKYKGIEDYNQIWSRFENERISLHAEKPSDVLSHFAGYSLAEQDMESGAGLKKLMQALYGNDLSRFKAAARKLAPQVYPAPENPDK